jgi:hypothetical protein
LPWCDLCDLDHSQRPGAAACSAPPSSWWVTVGCGVERLAAVQAAGAAVHIRLSDCLPGESPVGGAPPRAPGAVVGGRWGVCAPSRCASVAQRRLPERCARARALGSVWPRALAGDAAVPAGGLGRDASRRPAPVSPHRWSELRKRSERIRGKRAFAASPPSLRGRGAAVGASHGHPC